MTERFYFVYIVTDSIEPGITKSYYYVDAIKAISVDDASIKVKEKHSYLDTNLSNLVFLDSPLKPSKLKGQDHDDKD